MNKTGRLLDRLLRRTTSAGEPPITVDDPDLHVVAASFDETESASAALDRAEQLDVDLPAVLRHYLRIPSESAQAVHTVLDQDGWTVRTRCGQPREEGADDSGPRGATVTVIALRVQHIDAMSCSRESSRMVGLAQRFGGDTLGWDVSQPRNPR